jgi:halimadienyl-diphosphate synthase
MNEDNTNTTFDSNVDSLLARLNSAQSMSVSIYDTVKMLEIQHEFERYRDFVRKLLQSTCRDDGSWGSEFFLVEDRLINTLSAIKFLRTSNDSSASGLIEHAEVFCKSVVNDLSLHVRRPVASEALLPRLWIEAQISGDYPESLKILQAHFDKKLALISGKRIFAKPNPLVHTLELFDVSQNQEDLNRLFHHSGNIGNSPAATMSYFFSTNDPMALKFLKKVWNDYGGGFPVNYPIEIFELNWVLYFLTFAAPNILNKCRDLILKLRNIWDPVSGIAWSENFPVEDLDDTSITYLLFCRSGFDPDVSVFRSFLYGDQIMCFPGETHKAVTHLAHLVEALNVSNKKDLELKELAMKDVLSLQIKPGVWLDKWHVSPYYATSQVLLSCEKDLPSSVVSNSLSWLTDSQNSDGGWGEIVSTIEETSYVVLAIANNHTISEEQREQMFQSARVFFQNAPEKYVDMWIDKNLYCPFNVVRAAYIAAQRLLKLL